MSFSKKLKELRKARGMSLADLASPMGVARQTVHEWEAGETMPRMERIPLLATLLQVTQAELLDDELPLTPEPEWGKWGGHVAEEQATYPSLQPILAWQHEDELPPGEFVMVPKLDVKLSAGNGHEQIELELATTTPLAFRASWIREKHLKPAKLAAMTATGNSMEPSIFNGDSLLIDTSQTEVVDGRVYAIWYNGGERVKRLFRLPGGVLRIKSDNPDHPPIEVPADHQEHVRILGRVVHRSGDGGL